MAVVSWNAAFELTPAGDDSPDTIDDRIRELKENIRYRLDKEHNLDFADASADQGWHTMGSAKIYVGTSEPTQRPDNSTALDTDDIGRLLLRSDENNSLYVWGGSSWVLLVDNTQEVLTTSDVEFNSVTAGTFNVTSFTGGLRVSDKVYGNNISQNTVFNALDSYIPDNGDSIPVWGSMAYRDGSGHIETFIFSHADRQTATEIRLRATNITFISTSGLMNVDSTTVGVTDGSATTFEGISICW
jgi:hypothetical protein